MGFKFSRKCLGLRFSDQAALDPSDVNLFLMVLLFYWMNALFHVSGLLVHRKLVAVLELSQRYEYHCYNLEKELSKVYGQNYQYQETNWRKKDVVFLKDLKRVVKRTVESQTDPMRTATNSRNGVASVHATSSPLPRPKAISFVAASQTELEPLDSRDAERLAEARYRLITWVNRHILQYSVL